MAEADSDVVVWASRYYAYVTFLSGGGSSENPNSPFPQIIADGSGGGAPITSIPHDWVCPSKDASAKKAADEIKETPSSFSSEFSGAIVQTDNNAFSISGGELTSNSTTINGQTTATVQAIQADIPHIVGTIHNHPAGRESPAEAAADRYPSDLDWAGVDSLARNNPDIDFSNFTIYIVDQSGAVRGFQYSNRVQYPKDADIERRRSGDQLPNPIVNSSGCFR